MIMEHLCHLKIINHKSILKSEDITLLTKDRTIKATVFPCIGVRIGLYKRLST